MGIECDTGIGTVQGGEDGTGRPHLLGARGEDFAHRSQLGGMDTDSSGEAVLGEAPGVGPEGILVPEVP